MSSLNFKKKLKMANKLWKGAKEKAESQSFGSEIEDGRYLAKMVSAEIGESQSSGRLQVAWKYEILEGESKGESIFSYDGLETEDNLMWLARKLAKLNYEAPEDLEGVEEVLEEIRSAKPKVRIRIKTKGEFQNVYIDKLFEGGEGEEIPEKEITPEDPEETSLEKGMKVSFEIKGEETSGEVLEILEDEEKVRVETEEGKVYHVSINKLTLLEPEDDPEPEPEEEISKKKVVKKKPRRK